MAHVLLGWELGANRGHAVRLVALAAMLRAAGHRTSFAVQRIDALRPEDVPGCAVWQAPVTPRFLISASRAAAGPPAGMADILARVGMDDPALVAAMIRGWEQLFAAIRPDVIVGDFAPFLHLAVRDRLPLVAVGTGFGLPPADMPTLPALIEGPPGIDQPALVERLNESLSALDRPSLSTLARVWAADRVLPATLPELDPYHARRSEAYLLPSGPDVDARAGGGEEVFVYAAERVAADSPIWRGLARSGLPVRVHVPRAAPALQAALAALGFEVEPRPLPIATIVARSRLLVSHGGHGFVSAGLFAGLPQVVFHHDLEKLLNGLALARLGLGGHVALATLDPDRFGADLAALHGDDALAARARTAGARFRARAMPHADAAVVEAVRALA